MANPQCENGYTKIANELIDALMLVNLSPCESRVFWFLVRKTYGFGKKTDTIPLSQFEKSLNLDRRNVHRALQKLSDKKMITIGDGIKKALTYGIQKDYEKWNLSSKQTTDLSSKQMTDKTPSIIQTDDRLSSKQMTDLSSKQTPSKENTKETIQKTSTENRSTCPHKIILDLYHEILPELPRMRIWSEEREAHLRTRWNSGISLRDGTPINTLEYWRRFFEYIRQSDFLMGNTQGRNGQKPFRSNLEWLVKKSNFIKVIEGQYHG